MHSNRLALEKDHAHDFFSEVEYNVLILFRMGHDNETDSMEDWKNEGKDNNARQMSKKIFTMERPLMVAIRAELCHVGGQLERHAETVVGHASHFVEVQLATEKKNKWEKVERENDDKT